MLTRTELIEARRNAIVVSNRLIQERYFELSEIPLKTLLYTISKIKPDDEPNKKYTLSVRELCEVCNLKITGTNRYKGRRGLIYAVMRELRARHLDLYDEKGLEFNTGWFNKVKMEEDNDTVSYYFDIDLMPYLFQLKIGMGNLTITTLEILCAMDRASSIRLYLFLRSIAGMGVRQRVMLDELKDRIGMSGKYENFYDMRMRILTPAIEDINLYSDLEVSYNEVKEGKKVVALDFHIKSKHTATLSQEVLSIKALNRAKRFVIGNPNRTARQVANVKYRKRGEEQ